MSRNICENKIFAYRTGRSSSAGEEKGISAGPSGLDSSSESIDGDIAGSSLPLERKPSLELSQVCKTLGRSRRKTKKKWLQQKFQRIAGDVSELVFPALFRQHCMT